MAILRRSIVRPVPREVILCLGLMVATCGTVIAQVAAPGDAASEQKPPAWTTSALTFRLFPAGDVYPVYVADPQRPSNAVVQSFYSRTRVPEASSPRTSLAAGGRFGILRIDSRAAAARLWQVSIEAGLDAIFDAQFKADAVGWDGNYGLTVTTTTPTSPFGFKIAVLHTSAHLGDEYQERTGATRINYTREELALGAAWRFRPRWRAYGELGLGYLRRSEGQDQWRWQAGVEYEARPAVFGNRMAWYGAADLSALQERDWRLDTSLQGGLVTRSDGRAYRLFVQWYDGRVTLGQFTLYSEATFSFGLKIDL